MKTVQEHCPKDCRFIGWLNNNTPFYDYGRIARAEGLTDHQMRGGTVEECTVYEKKKRGRKRRKTKHPAISYDFR